MALFAWIDPAAATECDGTAIANFCEEQNTNEYWYYCPTLQEPWRKCTEWAVDELAKAECIYREWWSCETGGTNLCDAYPAVNGALVDWLEDQRDAGEIESASECYDLGSNAGLAATLAGLIADYLADVTVPGASNLVKHFLNCACNEVDWTVSTGTTARLCNESGEKLWAAVGFMRAEDDVWVSKGWYAFEDAECRDVLSDYTGDGKIYVYAQRDYHAYYWIPADDELGEFCIHASEAFEFTDADCDATDDPEIRWQDFGAIQDLDNNGVAQFTFFP